MSARPVEAVFFWRYNISAYRAAYGRKDGTTYTKDFLQSGVSQYPLIDDVLERGTKDEVRINIRWVGGERGGYWKKSPSAGDNRCRLGWDHDDSPLPWRVGDPSTNPAISIPGDPTHPSASAADQEYAALRAKNLKPVLLAIKLRGEDGILHARAYLETPSSELASRGVATLPQVVQAAISSSSKDIGALVLQAGNVRAPELVGRILDALARDPNVLLIGPPGTGKTVALEDLRSIYEGRVREVTFDPDKWEGAWSELLPPTRETKVLSLVFHPSYSYEDFVAGLVPSSTGQSLELAGRPGPLISLAHWASQAGRRALLVLDEFNRAHAAAVFGDTLVLLDKEKRKDMANGVDGASVLRPHPAVRMEVSDEFQNDTGKLIGNLLSLPRSLSVVAALNSSDRSVAPLDAALRRRFAIIRVGPDLSILAKRLNIPWPQVGPLELQDDVAQWTTNDVKRLSLRLLEVLNTRIESLLGEDFLLGHALFWSVEGADANALLDSLRRAFDERVAATLRMTFADQDEALAAVFGLTMQSDGEAGASGPRVARWVSPPSGMESVAAPRLRVDGLTGMPLEQAALSMYALVR